MSEICNCECKACISNILDDMSAITDGMERLEYLVDLAKDLPCLRDEYRKDCFKVKGCLSNLWIVPEMKDGKCYFHCDGDAMIPKGIAFILAALHSGYSPNEILELDMSAVKKLGLENFLSPNRRDSLTRVPETIKKYARQFLEEVDCKNCPSAKNSEQKSEKLSIINQ